MIIVVANVLFAALWFAQSGECLYIEKDPTKLRKLADRNRLVHHTKIMIFKDYEWVAGGTWERLRPHHLFGAAVSTIVCVHSDDVTDTLKCSSCDMPQGCKLETLRIYCLDDNGATDPDKHCLLRYNLRCPGGNPFLFRYPVPNKELETFCDPFGDCIHRLYYEIEPTDEKNGCVVHDDFAYDDPEDCTEI